MVLGSVAFQPRTDDIWKTPIWYCLPERAKEWPFMSLLEIRRTQRDCLSSLILRLNILWGWEFPSLGSEEKRWLAAHFQFLKPSAYSHVLLPEGKPREDVAEIAG